MNYKTIRLKRYLKINEEYFAHEALTPGHLLELRSDGKVQKHSNEDKNAVPLFAQEDELQGKTISDEYAQHDPVQVWVPTRGDQVYALLKANEEVDIGDYLVSAGDGTLKKYNPSVHSDTDEVHPLKIVGQALTAVNESTVERIVIRIV